MSTFGAMLATTPTGESAGTIVVADDVDGVSVGEPEQAGVERFGDYASAVREVLHRTVKRLIAARPDLIWVHGGVAALGNQALVFSGPSGQGKSSLVAALIAHEWTYLTDEITAIDPVAAIVLPFPVTPYMRVDGGKGLTAEEVIGLDKTQVHVTPQAVATTGVPLTGVYFLSYHPDADTTEASECSPAAAVVEMLRNSLNPSESREVEISALCRLMSRVQSRYLHHGNFREAAKWIVRAQLADIPSDLDSARRSGVRSS